MKYGTRIWIEDDATMFMGAEDHEDERAAWRRLFNEKLDLKKAVEKIDDGCEPFWYRMPNGVIICRSADGTEFLNPPGK